MTRGRGPLADSYPAAVALVVCALVPFLMLSAAVFPLAPLISKSVGLSMPVLDVTIGLSDAAYAFGTVLAVQFAVHLPARRMLLGYVTVFVVAAVLAAWAPNGPVFAVAFIIEGLCTSLMLIAAVPPLVTGWPTAKMPWTGLIMNLCIFGAVALGPTIGGLQAASGAWRPLFWSVAAVGGLALLLSLLTEAAGSPERPVGVLARMDPRLPLLCERGRLSLGAIHRLRRLSGMPGDSRAVASVGRPCPGHRGHFSCLTGQLAAGRLSGDIGAVSGGDGE